MSPKNSGISLREIHFNQFDSAHHFNFAFEVIFENFLFTLGERKDRLQELSKQRFLHLHGVSSNIASIDELNDNVFHDLKKFGIKMKASLYSDHLCWTRINQKSTYELLPAPRTRNMVEHIGQRVEKIRDILGQDFLLENISSYFSYKIDEMTELEFMCELYDRYQVRYLLDVNNLYVNSKNFGFNASQFIQALPLESVAAFHLGGHEDFGSFLFDTHAAQVIEPVKLLFLESEKRFGEKPTFLERDENIPEDIEVLISELSYLSGVGNSKLIGSRQ